MARIAGVELPDKKQIRIALTYIYGIGRTTALEILESMNIDPFTSLSELDDTKINQLRKHIEDNFMIEGELRQKVFRDIKRLKDIRAYRGVRHKIGLPVKGQRTRVNARTRKGKARAVGGLKRKITKT